MSSLVSLFLSLLVLCVGAGLGCTLSRLWRAQDKPRLDGLVIDCALGLGVLSHLVFGMLSAGWIRPQQVWVLAPFLGFVWPFVARVFRTARGSGFTLRPASVPAAVLFVILALAVLVPALVPPSMSDYDTLAYHFAIPELYLKHGGIYRIDFASHSNFPFLMEMLYVPGLAMNDPVAAKLMNYWVGALLVLSTIVLTRKHFNAKAAPMAAIAFAGMPIVLWLATTAYVDLATALYTVASVHLLLNYLDKPEHKSLIGCGVAAGFAASTKMTGLGIIPLLLAWLLIDRWASEKKLEWKQGLMFVGVALLVCSPWYIKSIIYTGNPVYPFFYSIFGGRNWSTALASHYATQQSLFGMGHDAGAFLLLPFNLTFECALRHLGKFYDRPGLFIGPIFLLAVPLLFAARYRSRKLIGLLGFFVALVVEWFMLSHQSRYLVPAFAILAVLIAAIAYQDERFRLARVALMAVFVATALFGVLTLWPAVQSAAPVVFGRETRDEYLTRTLDIYPAQQFMNDHLPLRARVLFFGDTRGFYLHRDYAWGDYGHNVEFSRKYDSVGDMIGYLKSKRVTHVMINFHFYPPRGKGTETVYRAIDDGRFARIFPVDGSGAVGVYEVR
ncbi:MAG: glycosyltransferase family 39 protein [Armatimonadetes bacterium]|nr:glycosyltransferase family 39 protein [Armatimonadota bacterium]